MKMNEKELLWHKMASELCVYFVFEDIEALERFNEILSKEFDFIDDTMNINKCISQIRSRFMLHRGSYEKEYNAVLGECKRQFKLKGE